MSKLDDIYLETLEDIIGLSGGSITFNEESGKVRSKSKQQIKDLILKTFDSCIGGGRTHGETIEEFEKKVSEL